MTQDKETQSEYYFRKRDGLASQYQGTPMLCKNCSVSGVAGEDLAFVLNVTFMPQGVIETETAQCFDDQACAARVEKSQAKVVDESA